MPSHLTSTAANEYLKAHGYNEITQKTESLLQKAIHQIISPISIMLLAASILSFFSNKIFDASFIVFLLVLNIIIMLWQEHKADTAIEKLNEHLAITVKVLRDNAWHMLNARLLVPHDIVELKAGDVIPADAKVIQANNVSVNEAAITGESLPQDRKENETLYSGSFLASGLATIEITATGNHTYFGKTLSKVEATNKKSALEKEILRISRSLSILSIGAMLFLTIVLWLHNTAFTEILRLDLSLLIAGIPISLPTVMTLIIAFGVVALAKKNVVVRRLASLEELANTDLLLTDKTGTLTKNKIMVDTVHTYNETSVEEVRRIAQLVALQEPDITINQAILRDVTPTPSTTISYVPADSIRKRSTLTFLDTNVHKTAALGAPQIIATLCHLSPSLQQQFTQDVETFAKRGYRTLALAVAQGDQETNMQLVGVLSLSDELREDAKTAIAFLKENGVEVAMVTGDNKAIAKEIAGKLSMPGEVVTTRTELLAQGWDTLTADTFHRTQAFAEILPEDKYALVQKAKQFYTVAANGDGVNDLPAVKEANVGFAVKNAVDALKGTADIVLLSTGISVMRDAFIEGRKIFIRLNSYALYRISESLRLIITIAILGFLTGTYPLSPLQLILIALLNDIPIVSLAFDRVRVVHKPSKINTRAQFIKGSLFGVVGIIESVLLFFFALEYLHLPWPAIQTLFFLKLTVSGHMLIYVTHTDSPWYRYLPSAQVIYATLITQGIATLLAITGFLMSGSISWQIALLVWIWTFCFMQIAEVVKQMWQHTHYESPVTKVSSA